MKIAIVGLGYWGPNLLRNFAGLADVELVLFDANPELAEKYGESYKVPIAKDYNSILSDKSIAAVVLATPVQTHFQLASDALKAGKHVFVEKPMTYIPNESEQLVEIAKENQVKLFVGHVFLYNPAVLKIKEWIDDGTLGDLIYIHSMRTNFGPIRKDVDVLWDLCPHDASIFSYWCGGGAVSASATGIKHLPHGKSDAVFGTLLYDNNVAAHCHASWITPKKIRQVIVVGSKKMLIWDDMNLQEPIRIYNRGIGHDHTEDIDFAQYISSIGDGDIHIPKIPHGEPLKNECQSFIDYCQGKGEALSDGKNGLDVVKTMHAIEKSIEQHGAMIKL
jgi:predicted dehydrogenase